MKRDRSHRGEGKPEKRKTGWFIRVRMPDGARPLVKLGPPTMSAAMLAERVAAWRERRDEMIRIHLAQRAQPDAPAKPSTVPTFREFAERWTKGELANQYRDHIKKKSSAPDDAWRLGKHIYPVLGPMRLDEIALEDADRVMEKIPEAASPTTRRHVAQLMVRVMTMAAFPCRYIKVSPIPKGYLPGQGPKKALAHLYPDEDLRLLQCSTIPICYRMLYGFLHREGMRSGEAAALNWADLDLARGAVKLDENKTDDPRMWALSPDVQRALKAWRAIRERVEPRLVAPREPVFIQHNGARINVDRGAERYRTHLRQAGVERLELFESGAARRPIRLHDARATFVTVSLANGKTDTWVKDRTGHRSSVMLENYRRTARALAELDLGPFADMDASIPELKAWDGKGH
ncbi:MAG: site-specific integrase [Polyangiaceae bacterium]|nr:site-specific integrase [Polyangiaceae bacterium]